MTKSHVHDLNQGKKKLGAIIMVISHNIVATTSILSHQQILETLPRDFPVLLEILKYI